MDGSRPLNPRVPRSVGLVDLSAGAADGAAGLLLADLAEAMRVYDRLGHAGEAGYEPLEVMRVEPEGVGEVDSLVVALGEGAAVPALDGLALATGQRVYGLGVFAGDVPGGASTFGSLAAACVAVGAVWCGVLVAPRAGLVARFAPGPRMGLFRRGVSEAMDDLIVAIRSGIPVGEAGKDTLQARLPRIARLLAG